MKLTDLEKTVLLAFNTNYECAENEKMDNASYTDLEDIQDATGLEINTIKGVVGSLVKKDLVSRYEDYSFNCLVLEDDGIDLYFSIKA